MRPNDYGPVPVSRIKSESTAIFSALATHRRVLVSKHGRVVAAIDPPEAISRELLADYAVPGDRVLAELTASDINQGSPSAAVTAAVQGSPRYFTKDNRVFGLLREITDDDLLHQLPTRRQLEERERGLEEFLAQNPDAGAEQVAAVGDKLDATLGIPPAGAEFAVAAGGTMAHGTEALAGLRTHIESMARTYAEEAGKVTRLVLDDVENASLVRAIEVRTIEAIARVTEETLSPVAGRALKARSVTNATVAVAEARAEEALERLTQCAAAASVNGNG